MPYDPRRRIIGARVMANEGAPLPGPTYYSGARGGTLTLGRPDTMYRPSTGAPIVMIDTFGRDASYTGGYGTTEADLAAVTPDTGTVTPAADYSWPAAIFNFVKRFWYIFAALAVWYFFFRK